MCTHVDIKRMLSVNIAKSAVFVLQYLLAVVFQFFIGKTTTVTVMFSDVFLTLNFLLPVFSF